MSDDLLERIVKLESESRQADNDLKMKLKQALTRVSDLSGSMAELEKDNLRLRQLATSGAGKLIELTERLDGPPLKSDPERKRPSYEARVDQLDRIEAWIYGKDEQGFGGKSASQVLPELISFRDDKIREEQNKMAAEAEAAKQKESRKRTVSLVYTGILAVLSFTGFNISAGIYNGTLGARFAEQDRKIASNAESISELDSTPLAHLDYVESIRDAQQAQIDALKAFQNRHEEKLDAIGVTVRLPE